MNLKINKRIVVIILIYLLVISSFIALIYYFRKQDIKQNLRFVSLQADLNKVNKEYAETKNNYKKVSNDFDGLVKERDNLLIQIKGLLADRNLAKELEGTVEKNKQDIEALSKEKQELADKKLEQQNIIRQLELQQEKLLADKKQLSEELNKERDVSLLKRVEKEKESSLKENADLTSNLKLAKSKMHDLEEKSGKLAKDLDKAKTEVAELTQKSDKLNKKLVEAQEKNKKFEQKLVEEPKKFAQIAHENKLLVKQTANTHYNLGVFYTKQREYTRAIAEFEKTIELDPNDAYAHFNLGYIYAENVVDRGRAIKEFREFLRLAKSDDKDVDWVKNYLLTWESWDGKKPLD